MEQVIVTTTPSFAKAVQGSELKDILANARVSVHTLLGIVPPFPFDPNAVMGVVAGSSYSFGKAELSYFPNLKIVMPFGVGIDHIDQAALAAKGVVLRTAPGASKRAVAELAIAFLFALLRRLTESDRALKSGAWDRLYGQDIRGKTLGIIGLGNIGKEVARIARGLGTRVIANDLVYDEEFMRTHEIEAVDFETALHHSDILTLHVPLTELTRHIISASALSLMKPGSYLINTCRGEVVDEGALFNALASGHLAGAGIDVFSVEPPFSNETVLRVISHPSVIATGHIAAFTPEAHFAVAAKIWQDMSSLLHS